MEDPLVSIITPTYNHEGYIGMCIESVLSQTYKSWEMIIIDDASIDKTSSIVDEFAQAEPKIKLIRHENNYGIFNLADTYNEALSISQGDLVAILEGDDYWPSNKLELQVPYFNYPEVVLTWGDGDAVDDNQNITRKIRLRDYEERQQIYDNRPVGKALEELLFDNFIVPAVTVMIRNSPLQNIGGFKQPPGAPNVDYPTWLELSLQGEFRFVERILGYWRHHPDQNSRKYAASMVMGHAESALGFCERLRGSRYEEIGNIDYKLILSRYYWAQGKMHLAERDWQDARHSFMEMIKIPEASRIEAILGFLAGVFHFDLTSIQMQLSKLRS